MAQFYIKNALQKWHQRKRYSRPCQANCSKVLGWNYGICNSPIIEEVCISISELSNLPKVRRLLFLFKYMTIVLQYRRYVT
jgi:hypothetical protein